MPKKYRLSRADWLRLPRPVQRIHGSYFSLSAVPFPPLGGPRVALVVSKKIAKRAVDRNKIERRCREALRPLITKMRKPAALILHAKREAREASYAEVALDIGKLLRSLDARDTPR
ncbi:ribonuclease P protein component [Candidatus Kaiserbacteria bacterium]|nr:ribonuclease P protein component [Candidatus Kaiserbacteria bacterium]